MAKAPKPVEMGTPVHILDLTKSQEQALIILCAPVLAKIATLELLGYLPAIPSLPGVGAGAAVFTETRFLLDRTDGDHAVHAQMALYMLEANLVRRTRENYDHHITLTPLGLQALANLSGKF